MSSVEIDEHWYKRCMRCSEWTDYEDLRYEDPSDEHPYGLDLCPSCCPDQEPAGTITITLEN